MSQFLIERNQISEKIITYRNCEISEICNLVCKVTTFELLVLKSASLQKGEIHSDA